MRDDDIRELAREWIRERGVNQTAMALGISRPTVLSLAADAKCAPATFALIRERLSASRQGGA